MNQRCDLPGSSLERTALLQKRKFPATFFLLFLCAFSSQFQIVAAISSPS
ncbi:hypothetical protein LINPERPRIM_LOCUS18292 [Linum perenne]